MAAIKDKYIEDQYSLSPLQQGMLFHTLREKGVGMYISQAVYRHENLDCEAFEKAWQLMIDRHTVLRTSFHWDDPENPYQIVHRRVSVPFQKLDWRGQTPSEQNTRLRRLQQKEREQGFDLNQPTQIRIVVIQVTRNRWICINSNHHIILDGWSGALLAHEVKNAYTAFTRGSIPSFDPPVPFGNYIRWIASRDLAAAEEFWREHLASVTRPTPMPVEREMGPQARVRMHVEAWEIKLDDQAARQVSHFAARCRVTLHTVIQSVWPFLLSRYSGKKSVLFGMLVSGRPPELERVESIVGMFLNTIPFCVTVADDLSAGDWLRGLQEQHTRLQRYEYTSLMMVQQWSRIPGGMPLFTSIVARKDVTRAAGAPRRASRKRRGTAPEQATFQQNYPILLNITASSGISLKITYDARRFRAIDISRIMEQMRHLLVELSKDPDRKLKDIGLASGEELHQLRYEWNDTFMKVGPTPPLDRVVTQNARTGPDRMAVIHGGQEITYRELDRRIDRVAGQVRACGIGSGDVVAVSLEDPLKQVTTAMALMRAGARCLPSTRSSGDLLQNLSRSNACRIVICDRGGAGYDDRVSPENPDGTGSKNDMTDNEHIPLAIWLEDLESETPLPDPAWKNPDGKVPDTKAQCSATPETIRHDNGGISLIFPRQTGELQRVSNRFLGSRFSGRTVAFAPQTRLGVWESVDSLFFFSQLYACWQGSGTAVFLPRPSDTDMTSFCAAIAATAITRISITPSILALILKNQENAKQVSGISTWICTGEFFWPELGEVFNERFPKSGLVNVFSTRELGPCLAWEVPKGGLIAEGVRLGVPLPNIRAYVSPDGDCQAPVGVAGRLSLAADISGTTEEGLPVSHESVEKLPVSEPLHHTGAVVRRWNDGTLEYLGPIGSGSGKDTENGYDPDGLIQLWQAHRKLWQMPLVDMAAVLEAGQDVRLACICPRYEDPDLVTMHRQLCRVVTKDSAPTHYLVLPSWPLDRSGCTDRTILLAMRERAVDATNFVQVIRKPTSEIEKIIARIWMEVLHIDRISTDDNFFELGGHSLAATKVTARLTRILQSDIHLKGIFEAPTVSAFAEWIQSDRHQEERPFAIDLADRGKDAPLTFTQQQLWVLSQLFPRLSPYTIPKSAVFTGKMDVTAFENALKDIVERHEILRTVFVFHNGEPRQIVKSELDTLHLDQVDLSHLPEAERMEKARWYGAQLGRKTWDLERGPLIRFQLVKLHEDRFLLHTIFHHIIADGPSTAVYMSDLDALYNARSRGRPPRLPPLALQYADYAVWERENVKGELFERQMAYWRRKLDGASLLEIPTDFPRPPVHGFSGKKVNFEIPQKFGAGLYRIAREQGATMFMGLLAVYQLLLHKYSGQDDIVTGSVMTNRIRVELERLIGLFVNTVALRTDFSGDPDFRELLGRVKTSCLGAYANMDLPFEETIAQIQPHRDLSRQGSPLFQFMLVHQPERRGLQSRKKSSRPGFQPGALHHDTGHANFDMLLSTRDTAEGLIRVTLAYDTELFRPETIDRMILHLQHILESVTLDPDRPISRLDMSRDVEKKEILSLWNGEDVVPANRLVHHRITDNAKRFPAHTAVCYKDRSISYEELDRRAGRVSDRLKASGVRAESMVAICLPRGIDLIVGIVAILKAGGAFVPIDADYPAERIRYILEQTHCSVMLSNPDLAPGIRLQKADMGLIDITTSTTDQPAMDAAAVRVAPTDLAYVIFTSGSTGLPKGVMVEHHNLADIIQSQIKMFEITPESRVLQMLSISFDAAVGEIFRTLVAGGTLITADPDDLLPGPSLVQLLKENRITAVAMSPTALGAMPDCSTELVDLKTITVGGEACPQTVAQRWGKGRRLLNAYGPTETTIGATLAVNWDVRTRPPLGRPLPGVKVYVLDRKANLAPVGTPGELFIGGIGVTRGYLNRPDLTKKSFVPNRFSSIAGDRMYRTGDLVRWQSNGMLDFLGRIDLQVKIRGFRIELGEIETALAKYPDITHCTVNVHEYSGVKRLVAYTVPKPGAVTDPAKLRGFLKQKIPEYMIPAFFMTVDKIPVTSSGKVDRQALPAPEISDLAAENRDDTPPATELEKRLVQLWSEVLGIEKIGVLDNFFEIGGDSITAIRLAARAGSMGIALATKDLFVYQHIRELANYLESVPE